MKLYRYILIIVFSCFACKNNSIDKPKKPVNLIHKDKMVNIFYDLAIINAAKSINKFKLQEEGILPEDYIYRKHHIDSLQFAQSNTYYAYDVKAYQKLYDEVKNRIETQKEYYDKLVKEEKKVKDSLKKIKQTTRDSLKKSFLKRQEKPRTIVPIKTLDSTI